MMKEDQYYSDKHSSSSFQSGKSRQKDSETKSHREPNQNIVIQGLPFEVTEKDIYMALEILNASCENVRLVTEKHTGRSRGFAFVRFISTEHAKKFMRMHGPFVDIAGTLAHIAYSHTWETKEDGVVKMADDWICDQCKVNNFARRQVCFQCSTPKSKDAETVPHNSVRPMGINDGHRDVGDIPVSVLLIRGLSTSTTEETLFQVIERTSQSLVKEVRLVRDRASHASMGFAFVEFFDTQTAIQALSRILQLPVPMSIDQVYVQTSYAHQNSFMADYTPNEYAKSCYYDVSGNKVYWTYWDTQLYASMYMPADRYAAYTQSSSTLTLDTNETAGESLKRSADEMQDPLAAFYSDIAQAIEKDQDPFQLSDKKKQVAVKKMKVQIKRWQDRHEELKESDHVELDDQGDEMAGAASISDEALLKQLPSEKEMNESFSDYGKMACLLCQRQFKSVDTLNKHKEKSELHKTHMEEHVKKELEKLKEKLERDISQKQEVYRNRAAERRRLFGVAGPDNAFKKHRGTIPAIEEPTVRGIKSDNIGSKMLQKMGWKEGTGLGVDRSGMVNPIQPEVYAKGAGLGAVPGIATHASDKAKKVALMKSRYDA